MRPLIHGATYFAELHEWIEATRAGDLVLFTDWQGDADERLTGEPGSEVAEVLGRADERGVDVRGLVWRSHSSALRVHRGREPPARPDPPEARRRGAARHAGAHRRLAPPEAGRRPAPRRPDPRHRLRRRDRPVPLAPRRRRPRGRPAGPRDMADEYGATPPWHDIQAAISGPAVHDVETVFRERWEDPRPLSRNPVILLRTGCAASTRRPTRCRSRRRRRRRSTAAPRRPAAAHLPQPAPRRDYPFARGGERSVARGYTKAVQRARRLVYVEDQYLWGDHVGSVFTEALRDAPRPARGRRRAAAPGRRRASTAPPSSSGAAGRCSRWRGPAPTGWRSTASRTRPARRSTCTPRPASSTTPGRRRLRQLQPAVLDPRLRAVGGRRRHRPATTRARCG